MILRYSGKMTTGTGRPGVDRVILDSSSAELAIDVLAAPSGPLTLMDAQVWTHQFMVRVPLG